MEFLLATIPAAIVALIFMSRSYLRYRRSVKDQRRTKLLLLAFRNSIETKSPTLRVPDS